MVKSKKKSKPQKSKDQELTRLGSALRSLGGLGGRALGSFIGYGDAGSSLGHNLGAMVSRWLGSGDYTVSSNTIIDRMKASGSIPSMHKDGQTIVVRHKEFLTEVTGTTSFTVQQSFSINPGLQSTFPWLAGIANQYTEYRIRGMVYHYIPTSGMATTGTNPALGSVMLQTTYRASENPPTTKVELLNEYWSSESVPSEAFCHPIECDPKENPFNIQYVRIGAVPAGDSVLMYDLGKTFLATSGQQANGNVLGDLWVTYEIELRKPVLTNVNNFNIATFYGFGSSSVNTTTPLSTNFAEQKSSFQEDPVITGNTITFPKFSTGSYLVVISYDGTTTAANFSDPIITGAGSTLLPCLGTTAKKTAYTVGTRDPSLIFAVSITQPTTVTTVTINALTLVGASGVELVITEVNPNTIG